MYFFLLKTSDSKVNNAAYKDLIPYFGHILRQHCM